MGEWLSEGGQTTSYFRRGLWVPSREALHSAEDEQDLRLAACGLHLRPDPEPHGDALQAQAGHKEDLGREVCPPGVPRLLLPVQEPERLPQPHSDCSVEESRTRG